MQGKANRKKRSGRLRRPINYSSSGAERGASFSNPLTTQGDGTVAGAGLQAAPSTPAVDTADPLMEDPSAGDKVFYKGKLEGDASVEIVLASPLENEAGIRNTLRRQLTDQAGGVQCLTPTMTSLMFTVIEQRVLESKIVKAIARHGALRVDHKRGKVSGQAIIKEILLPLQGALRLNLRQFSDEAERLRGGRPQSADDLDLLLAGDKSPQEALDEMMMITGGLPVDDGGIMRPVTPEQKMEIFKRDYPAQYARFMQQQGAKTNE